MQEKQEKKSMAAEKMIKISKVAYGRLKDHGKFGDTFDEVLTRVLDENEALKTEVYKLKHPITRPALPE